MLSLLILYAKFYVRAIDAYAWSPTLRERNSSLTESSQRPLKLWSAMSQRCLVGVVLLDGRFAFPKTATDNSAQCKRYTQAISSGSATGALLKYAAG